ncbi:MAG: carbon-nitrogen hydrolase family protein [Anaerolineae bacterium]
MGMIVAAGQFTARPGNVGANVGVMCEQTTAAAGAGAKLIVFPELCVSGYLAPEEIPPLALELGAAALAPLRDTARRSKVDVAFGLAERAPDGQVYNSLAYLDCNGHYISVYHKAHLWDTERRWAVPGDGFHAFDSGHARCGMWICYDTRFPEVARLLAIDGATLALAATAWLGPADEWELALRARAMDNGMYAVGSALQGAYKQFDFHGGSLIVNPHGHVLAAAPAGSDMVITAEYDDGVVAGFRGRVPLLEHRRIDVFGPLLQPATW